MIFPKASLSFEGMSEDIPSETTASAIDGGKLRIYLT